jgi:hypothetical protein
VKCGAWLSDIGAETKPIQPDGSKHQGDTDESSLEQRVLSLMAQGRKIEAIKLYRQETCAGLKEAKDAVEALAAKHGIRAQRSGCAGTACLLLVVIVAVWLSLALTMV